ncbi:MAG: sorbosone dehydrogenase family protein, partial [Candidatus Heimdallarchaeota archaeon]
SRDPDTDNCNPCINLTISRFTIDNQNKNKINESSELIFLKIPQSRRNHRGGQLTFGPDGMLYISIGDGTMGTAGRLTDYNGKILRVDVSAGSGGLNYTIPPDNPFAGNSEGYKEEIYAYGLRNPWRTSFDKVTGTFWVGDVGNFTWEEINIVESGDNYGWPAKEGNDCVYFRATCPGNFTDPLVAYPHEPEDSSTFLEKLFGLSNELDKPSGTSVIGGFVYRGSNFPELVGKYIFADYTGGVWAIEYNFIAQSLESIEFLTRFPDTISSIGQGLDGELYFTGHLLGYIYEIKSLTNFIISITVILLIMISVSAIIGTIWVKLSLKRKKQTFDLRAELRSILNRAMFVFIVILLLIGLTYLIQLIFYSL